MAGVFIDIPGVGNVEAKNAATEATLQEILKAMQGVQKNTGSGGGGGGSGGGATTGPQGMLAKAANSAGAVYGKMRSAVMPVIGGFNALNSALTGTISAFASVEDDIGAAAKTIPILGGLFGTVADASKKVNKAFLDASQSGASFGGSVNNLARSASSAGMTMDKFASLVAKNGQGMLAFGGTTEAGAMRFAQVSKSLRQTSGDLYALGYSTEDINSGLANYGALLRQQGLQGKQSNTQLVDGAKRYLKELDAMAKITGEERSVKEAEMKKLAQDAQFQAAMAGKSEDVRMSFMKTVGSLPAPLQGFVKDFLATGTLTTEETQRIGAMMGGDVMNELQSMRNKMQSGTALTAAEQDRLAAIMKSAGEKQLKANSAALAASRDMDGATNAMVAATQLQIGAHKETAKAQQNAAATGDGFNKKMQEMQQGLAQYSNAFTMALANSGILDLMFKMFTGLADLVMTFVVPAFTVFTEIITTVAELLQPVFVSVADFLRDNFIPILLGVGTALAAYQAYVLVSNALEMAKAAVTTASTLGLSGLAAAAWSAAAPFIAIAVPVVALVALFKTLYDNGWSLSTAWDALKDNINRLGMNLLDFIDSIRAKLPEFMGGLSEDEAKSRAEKRNAERKELDIKEKARDKQRKATAEERKAQTQYTAGLKKSAEIVTEANKDLSIDYTSGPEALLKQSAAREGSAFIPKKEAAQNAEITKKELEARGEAKQAAEQKAQQEATSKAEAAQKTQQLTGTKGPASQESAESLLSQLNTNMNTLVKLMSQNVTNTYEQVVATKGLSSDLFTSM